MIELPTIPERILYSTYDVPCAEDLQHEQPNNIVELYQHLGWEQIHPGTIAQIRDEPEHGPFIVSTQFGRDKKRIALASPTALLALASVFEMYSWYRHGVRLPAWAAQSLYDFEISEGRPCIALLIQSSNHNEYLLIRRGYLHPTPHYCRRLSLLTEELTIPEAFLVWNMEHRPGGYEVALTRALYHQICDRRVRDELFEALAHVHPSLPTGKARTVRGITVPCHLLSQLGVPTLLNYELFTATARDDKQWERWCRELIQPSNGAQVSFERVHRERALELAEEDHRHHQGRLALLEKKPEEEIHLASTRALHQLLPYPSPTAPDLSKQLKDLHHDRRELFEHGGFPMMDRGTFHFIGGQAQLLRYF